MANSEKPDANAIRLQTIMRLRQGLPPQANFKELTVGYNDMISPTEKLFGSSRSWLMVIGNYGDGKTHFLDLLRHESLNRNFATCLLSGDTGNSALNHPQRFLGPLLNSLEVPGKHPGYANLVFDIAMTNYGLVRIKEIINDNADWMVERMPFKNALDDIAELESIVLSQSGRSKRGRSWAILFHRLIDSLTGETISHRSSAPSDREAVYRLLLIARDMVMEAGCRGIIFRIDEAESISTKLPNKISRMGAIRVLSSLCLSNKLRNILTAVSITPYGYDCLLEDIENYTSQFDFPARHFNHSNVKSFEPLTDFSTVISNGDHQSVDCSRFSINDAPVLLDGIRSLYIKTYPSSRAIILRDSRWRRFVQTNQSGELPKRVIIKLTVDLLDSIRLN